MIDLLDLNSRTDIKALAQNIKDTEPVITDSVIDQLEETLLKLQSKVCDTTTKHFYKYKTLQTHLLPVTNIAFDKLGKRCLTGSYDRTCKVWDIESGTELFTLQGHKNVVYAVSFNNPASDRILTGSFDKTANLWCARTGYFLHTFYGHDAEVVVVKFSPGQNQIATGSMDATAKVFQLATGHEIGTLKGHMAEVIALQYSRDGNQMVTGSFDGTINLWDVRTFKRTSCLIGHDSKISNCIYSFDCSIIASSSLDKTAKVWDVRMSSCLGTLTGHEDEVLDVALDNQGLRLATASSDATARVWDISGDFQELAILEGHREEVSKGDICEELDFDRTKYLDGYGMIIVCIPPFDHLSLSGRFLDQKMMQNHPEYFTKYTKSTIDALVTALNVTVLIYFPALQSSNELYLKSWAKYVQAIKSNSSCDIFLMPYTMSNAFIFPDFRGSYPFSLTEYGILTHHKGYQTFVEKIREFYGTWTILFTLLVLLATFAVIWFFEKKRISFTAFEIIRLFINQSLITRMNTLPIRIFFSMIFIYFLVIQATFNGHLAKFLTKPQLRKHADTLEDLTDLGYTAVYNMTAVQNGLARKATKDVAEMTVLVQICAEHILLNDTSAACIADYIDLNFQIIQKNNLYLSRTRFGSYYCAYPVRRESPLLKRMNLFFILLEDFGFHQFTRNDFNYYLFHDQRIVQARSEKNLRPIKLENLTFIFILLGIGLCGATLSFCIEVCINLWRRKKG